jgi:hypothetical protein
LSWTTAVYGLLIPSWGSKNGVRKQAGIARASGSKVDFRLSATLKGLAFNLQSTNQNIIHMKKILLVLLIFIAGISMTRAEITPEKRREIQKLLQLTGMEKLMEQMKTQMISALRQQLPDAPGDFWDTFQQKFDTKELIEKMIPIYDKYYTVEDLQAINAFYGSPAGKKILSTLPQVMQEAMKVGQEWGKKIGEEAEKEVEARRKK